MGPPPPPSASYLWKFDDDSDNDTADISSDIESANNIKMYNDDDDHDDYHYKNDDCKNTSIQSKSNYNSNIDYIQTLEKKDTSTGINHDKTTKSSTSASKSSVSSMIIETTRKNFIASNIYNTKPNHNNDMLQSIKSDDSPDSNNKNDIVANSKDNLYQNDDDNISVESNDNDDLDLDLDIDHGTVTTSTSSPTNSSKQKKKNKKKKHRKKKPMLQPVVVVPSEEEMLTTSTTNEIPTTKQIQSRQSSISSLRITNDNKNKHNQHVSFTTVSIYTFERCFGLCVVPTHGGWPLGMVYKHDESHNNDISNDNSNNINDDNSNSNNIVTCCTIDEYETNKYQRLLHRYEQQQQQIQSKQESSSTTTTTMSTTTTQQQKKNNNKSSNNNNNNKNKKNKIHRTYGTSSAQNTIDLNTNSDIIKNETLSSSTTTLLTLETRQWDYKQYKQKNPLFGILQETDRMNLLLFDSSSSNNISSNSITTKDNKSNNNTPSSNTNTRSNTRHAATTTTTSSNDHIHPIYTSSYANQIRNELEQIRIDRTTGIGCNCRKLHIPTTLSLSSSSSNNISNGHKKSKHRPMKLQKLKDELIKRNLLPPSVELDPNVSNGSDNNTASTDNNTNMTREEMEQLLNSVIEKESCCLYADTCFCVRNGIGCQADVCTCWRTSHQSTSTSSTSISNRSKSTTIVAPTIQEIQSRCGNTIDGGIYVVDDAKIDTFRDDYLLRLKVCPFITLES